MYFRRALRGLRLDLPENFLTPRRRERLRRLRPFLRVKAHQPDHRSESRLFHSLALRLDGLSDAVKPEKIWKHVGHDFDRLWKRAPLFAVELTGFQVDVLKALSGQDPSLI